MREHPSLRTSDLQVPTYPEDLVVQQRQLTLQAYKMADEPSQRNKRQDLAKVDRLLGLKCPSALAKAEVGP